MKKKHSIICFWQLFPGILLLAALPLIVRLQMVDTGLSDYPWFSGTAVQGDFFLCWKGIALFVLSVWMIVILVLKRMWLKEGKRQFDRAILWLGGYLLFGFLSAAFSEEKKAAFLGMFGSYQGFVVLLCYGVTALYFMELFRQKENQKVLMGALAVGAAIQGVIGTGQLLGIDFWNTALGRAIVAPGADNLTFRFGDSASNRVYLAAYNPNYAAVYCILVLPVLFSLIAVCKKVWEKSVLGILCGLLFLSLWGTGSRAGIMTAAGLLVTALLLVMKDWRTKGCVLGGIGLLICLVWIADGAGKGNVISNIVKSWRISPQEYSLKNIQIEEDGIRIWYKDQEILLNLWENEEGKLMFQAQNGEGEPVNIQEDEETGRYLVGPIRMLQFDVFVENGEWNLVMYQRGIPWYFVKSSNQETFRYLTVYGKEDVIEPAPHMLFEGREAMFSNRGYIWSRTIPLLAETVVFGKGPDTFAVNFLQNDYVMKANLGKDTFIQAFLRPHSMYLQIAIETGAVSLVCFLALTGTTLIRIWKKRKGDNRWNTGCFLSILGYCVMGLTNDFMIVTAPVFWAILGMGISRGKFLKNVGKMR